MDIMELGAIGELVGGVAVIASLLYVGLQVRQSNNLAQGAAELEVGRMNMEYMRLGAEGDYGSIWAKGFFEPDSLSEDERLRLAWAFGMWFHMLQSMYRQFRRGLLPESSWNTLVAAVTGGFDHSPLLKAAWDQNAFYLAPDFQRFVERQAQRDERKLYNLEEVSVLRRAGSRCDDSGRA